MSHTNDLSNLLNLKKPNIFFKDSCVSEERIKGITVKVFEGTLSDTPSECPKCGHKKADDLIHYGFKTTHIKIPSVSGFSALLRLKKQRCLCKGCGQTFTLKTTVVMENCSISRLTKLAIALDLKQKISEKDLAQKHNVSSSTVTRIIEDAFKLYQPSSDYLPKALCFDEFKSVKSAKGAMSFIYCDAETSEIMDIVEDWRLSVLIRYFSRFTKAARHGVKYIVIDLYTPYMALIKKLFPRALIIIDRFHSVQLISRGLNQTSIQVMKENKAYASKFKKNWRLFLKERSRVDSENYDYQNNFKRYMTHREVLEDLLSQDKQRAATYDFYQTLLYAIKKRDITFFKNTLHDDFKDLSPKMTVALKTLREQEASILNSLTYPYGNGRIEGLNNKIKAIKRIAFGYKSFLHFKNRILITQGILKMKAA